jgi:signal transduction histidine kinase
MSLVEDLRRNKVFSDLPQEDLEWLAARGTEVRLEPGEMLFPADAPADRLFVFFEGEIHMRRDGEVLFTARAGDVTGMLPFSRMTHFRAAGYAVEPTRLAWFSKSIFPEMLQRMPALSARMVGVLTDRVRESTKSDLQREKLASLGKLAAGLAHELNNPAAAAGRAAAALGETLSAMREMNLRLSRLDLTAQQREHLAQFELETGQRATTSPVMLNALEQSDREDQMTGWLETHHVADAWKLAPPLVEAGIDRRELDALAAEIGPEALSEVLFRVSSLLGVAALVREIEQSTARISELVKAIKEYSYMDQAPEQEVDIHAGLDSTLTVLNHKIKKAGVTVEREYDRTLARICTWASELNQVWTNLIDNAVDAMSANGEGAARRLRVRTARDGEGVLVEIGDTGPGIPPEIRGRIFDPFFTTKGVGEGTGLGLDTARRVVLKHRGNIRVESKPGDTRFQVRLPFRRPL